MFDQLEDLLTYGYLLKQFFALQPESLSYFDSVHFIKTYKILLFYMKPYLTLILSFQAIAL